MEVVSKSVSGRRSQNEDAAFCWSGDVAGTPCAILVVADGMGGHQGGQEASRLAVEAVESTWSTFLSGSSEQRSVGDYRRFLKQAVRTASEEVRGYKGGQEDLSDMGTTLTMACVTGDKTLFANVGDSRSYLVTETEILQVTEDHSAIAESLRKGKISETEARELPYQDALTRSIGGGGTEVKPDLFPAPEAETWRGYYVVDGGLFVPENCALLSCSDGLTKSLTDIEIYDCLRHTRTLEEGVRQLVLTAYQKGSTDNVTVAALERGRIPRLTPYRSGGPLPTEATSSEETTPTNGSPETGANQRSSRILWLLLLGLVGLLLLLAAAFLRGGYELAL